MRKHIFPLLSICLFTVLVSCNNTILPIRIPTGEPSIPQNNIVKEIPRYPQNNKVFLFYKLAKQKQKQLNLSVPENGYDNLLLRFWFTYPEGLYQYSELLEIEYPVDADPTARYTRMRIFFNPTRDYENINSHADSIITTPKSGWDKFTIDMNHLDIANLPTIEDIPKYKELAGGIYDYGNNFLTVACEIATKDKYRFIQYNNFEKYKEIEEVGNMYDFIRLLRSEFYMREITDEWYGE